MVTLKHSPACAVVTFRKDRRKSNFAQVGTDCTSKYTDKRESNWKANFSTLEPDKLQHQSPASCVIVHQYPFSTFLLYRFHSLVEKMRALQKCSY